MTSETTPLPLAVLCLHLAGGTADEVAKLARAFGPPDRWLEASPDEWRRAGLSEVRANALDHLRDGRAAEAERAECARRDIRLAWHGEADFPAGFGHLGQPPLVLAVQGRWPPPERALAVVGSRAATPYGLTCTRRLAGAAARGGRGIISGLARGIDRAADEAALAEGGWPVAVLGNGLRRPYPPENSGLQLEIARHGTLLTEFRLDHPPDTWTFPRRNRLIAALADTLLVVEADQRSGALITARLALDLGRNVVAVPGPIDSPTSQGTNRLIADGSPPILSVEDLLFELDGVSRAPAQAPPDDPLLAALGAAALVPDELAERAGRPVSEVRAALVALELQRRVRRLEGGRYAAG
jgi:DNA processing protein